MEIDGVESPLSARTRWALVMVFAIAMACVEAASVFYIRALVDRDWDILFRLPLPWWAPVLAPVSIAVVMILWGTLTTEAEDVASGGRWPWAFGSVGIFMALTVFMMVTVR
jgi:hypothetical protein